MSTMSRDICLRCRDTSQYRPNWTVFEPSRDQHPDPAQRATLDPATETPRDPSLRARLGSGRQRSVDARVESMLEVRNKPCQRVSARFGAKHYPNPLGADLQSKRMPNVKIHRICLPLKLRNLTRHSP